MDDHGRQSLLGNGYRLDLVSVHGAIVLRREDGSEVVGLGLTRFRGPIRVKRSGSMKGVEDGQDRQNLAA
jgi:hypothetical protein